MAKAKVIAKKHTLLIYPSTLRTFNKYTQHFDRTIGDGLFTNREIAANQVICHFHGQLRNPKLISEDARKYTVEITKDLFLDCYEERLADRCRASLTNDPRNCINVNTKKSAIANCCLKVNEEKKKAYLLSITKINKNEEILLDYGNKYWKYLNKK